MSDELTSHPIFGEIAAVQRHNEMKGEDTRYRRGSAFPRNGGNTVGQEQLQGLHPMAQDCSIVQG